MVAQKCTFLYFSRQNPPEIPKCHLLCHLFEAEQLELRFTVPDFRGDARGSGNSKRTRPDERIKEVTKVSLNPLPPERLLRSSEEREKSSEPSAKVDAEEDDDESAGSCGDIEDNLDDTNTNKMDVSINIQVI